MPSRKPIRAAFALGAGALALLLSGCGKSANFGFDSGVSSVNDISLPLWNWSWFTAAVVGVFTLALIAYTSIFHRRKSDAIPKQSQYNIPVEIAYTIIPFLIVAVLFGFTAIDENKITKAQPGVVKHEIGIEGIQWSWQFIYPEAGAKAIVTGTPAQPPTLYLPLGERVRFDLTSNDVVHGFWIPAFMIQIQNLPGVTNHLEFTANKLGEFPGRCNMLCGRNHSEMIFKVKVVTPAEYQSYLETLKAVQS
jgi:cytochrome c oxidase subunit 2